MHPYSPDKVTLFPDRVRDAQHGVAPRPVQVLVSVVDHCNHRCSWCSFAHAHVREYMSESTFELLLDDAAALGVRAVQFTGGGEPTLHPRFARLFEYALDRSFAAGLIANGSGITDRTAQVLERAEWIRVSINGGTREEYRRVHGRDHWDKAWGVVQRFAGCTKPVVGVSCVVDGVDVLALAAAARDAGAAYVRFTAKEIGGEAEWARAQPLLDGVTDIEIIRRPPPRSTVYPRCWYQYLAPFVGADGRVYRCCNTAYTDRGFVGTRLRDAAYSPLDARDCAVCVHRDKNDAVRRLAAGPSGSDFFV